VLHGLLERLDTPPESMSCRSTILSFPLFAFHPWRRRHTSLRNSLRSRAHRDSSATLPDKPRSVPWRYSLRSWGTAIRRSRDGRLGQGSDGNVLELHRARDAAGGQPICSLTTETTPNVSAKWRWSTGLSDPRVDAFLGADRHVPVARGDLTDASRTPRIPHHRRQTTMWDSLLGSHGLRHALDTLLSQTRPFPVHAASLPNTQKTACIPPFRKAAPRPVRWVSPPPRAVGTRSGATRLAYRQPEERARPVHVR
jgi:hypothetical protein